MFAACLAGCGGGNSGGGSLSAASVGRGAGRAAITLKWPVRATFRLIPVASNRVVITLKKNNVAVGAPVIFDRPASGGLTATQTVSSLPTGNYTADAFAYPDATSGAVAQAKAVGQAFTIADGQTSSLNLTMASAITSITVTATESAVSVGVGGALQVAALAKDAGDNTVLTGGSVTFASNHTDIATVDAASGLVTRLALGTVRITATDSESGVSGFFDVTVQNPLPAFVVADFGNGRIAGMRSASNPIWTSFGAIGNGAGQFNGPVGIATDALHRIYICDTHNSRIVRINDMSGAGWVSLSGAGGHSFINPQNIAIDSQNRIYVTSYQSGVLIRINDMTGAGWTEYGATGSGAGQFNAPYGIALDAQNRIYVADSGNARVVRIDDMTGANWTTLTAMGGKL